MTLWSLQRGHGNVSFLLAAANYYGWQLRIIKAGSYSNCSCSVGILPVAAQPDEGAHTDATRARDEHDDVSRCHDPEGEQVERRMTVIIILLAGVSVEVTVRAVDPHVAWKTTRAQTVHMCDH